VKIKMFGWTGVDEGVVSVDENNVKYVAG